MIQPIHIQHIHVCVCVYIRQTVTLHHRTTLNVDKQPSIVRFYLDCRSLSRRGIMAVKWQCTVARLSHIIEFTRRRHMYGTAVLGRRGSQEAAALDVHGLGLSAAPPSPTSSRRELKWRRNMSNRTAFRHAKICIGIAARRSLWRVEWVRAAFCALHRLIVVRTNDDHMHETCRQIPRRAVYFTVRSKKYLQIILNNQACVQYKKIRNSLQLQCIKVNLFATKFGFSSVNRPILHCSE